MPLPPEAVTDPTAAAEPKQRVRIPLFPLYRQVRHLLRVWPGRPPRAVTGLQGTLGSLLGTPKAPVDWSDPDTWIPARLNGDDRELAAAVWKSSGGEVNPRYTYGHWLLCRKYDLVTEGTAGLLCLTEAGRDFLDHEDGATVAHLDEQEGLARILAAVADSGPVRPGGLFDEWSGYLGRYSSFRTANSARDTLWRRLQNLRDRGLVGREGTLYSVTEAGLAQLRRTRAGEGRGDDEQQEIRELARKQREAVRGRVRELLHGMDPGGFEYLVKQLLEEMGYQNVAVTPLSGDGGVDVTADIELGITSVHEVVQVKRYRRTVQRKDLDALRGCLHRFQAVRGTIITTSVFSRGTKEAAFEPGAAPITLIDGEKLVDLLVTYGIGVNKQTVDVLALDPDAFSVTETGTGG